LAYQSKQPCAIEIKGFADDVVTKSPVAETGLTGGLGQLPPLIMPGRAVSLPYEPTRVWNWIPSVTMQGPSVAWLQHVSNATEVSAVAELGTKPDIGPGFQEFVVKPTKIAGLASLSLEASMDYPEWGGWIQTELTRSLINQESLALLQAGYSGGPTGYTFNGLLAQSGTLTRAVGSDTPLDALSKSYVDLRVGPAFAEPDLVIMHPQTWGALRRAKDANGRYLLDLMYGPAQLTADGSPLVRGASGEAPFGVIPQGQASTGTGYGQLWGVPICETTQCPAGTAVVMSIRAGAAFGYTRMGLLLQYNPFGDAEWTQNYYTWRCEERIALTVPRPQAINIVTGLPTS
jgi:hypothetical protein